MTISFSPALSHGAGHIHRLLRADVPVAAEVVAVDPRKAFAPRAQVEEGVAGLFDVHPHAIETPGRSVSKSEYMSSREHLASSGRLKICQPVNSLPASCHRAVDALAVVHFRAEVHAAHRLDEDVERRLRRCARATATLKFRCAAGP